MQYKTESRTNFRSEYLFLYLHFVNFLALLQLVNVMSNQSDCLFKFHHVNRRGLLLNRPRYYQSTTSRLSQCKAV